MIKTTVEMDIYNISDQFKKNDIQEQSAPHWW